MNQALDLLLSVDLTAVGGGDLSWEDIRLLRRIAGLPRSTTAELADSMGLSPEAAGERTRELSRKGYLDSRRPSSVGRQVVELSAGGLGALRGLEGLLASKTSAAEANCRDRALARMLDAIADPACIIGPIRDGGGAVADLEIRDSNEAFRGLFINKGLFARAARVSDFEFPEREAALAAASAVLGGARPRRLRLFLESRMRETDWRLSRMSGDILVARMLPRSPRPGREASPSALSRFQAFFDSGPIKLILDRRNGRILDANSKAVEFYGWDQAELRRMTIYELTASSRERVAAECESMLRGGHAILHAVHRLAGGEARPVEGHASPGYWGNRAIVYLIVFEEREDRRPTTPSPDGAAPVPAARLEDFAPFFENYGKFIPYLEELLGRLLPYGRRIRYRKGEHFLEYGELRPNIVFILEGLFRHYTVTEQGTECSIHIYRQGQIFHSIFFADLERANPLALEAMSDGEVFIVDEKHMYPFVNKDPRYFKLFYVDMISGFLSLYRRGISLLGDDASTRYRKFMEEEADAAEALRGSQAASYLGIASETLSRIKKRYEAPRRSP